MDLTKKYLLRLPDENVTLTKDELVARVKEILKDHPSEHMNAYRVWYEGFEGCGMPGTDVYDVIVETMRSMTDDWKDIGPMRWEKYGVVNPSFLNLNYANARKTDPFGNDMLQHRFHLGKHYQGPDGKIYWIPVMEDYDLRAFERKDGKYVGTMVEIDPRSDYAKAMVEVKV
ncbi:MAG: hypothetical protein IKS27_06975 [Oscillospiraceae bacterium]|nr:hypothetical protein [Oscillospiraceae bacterium]MBQ8930501.1 hypothetical protein [Oscillospiraceae bacterium]MBR6430940.1 hypothetical protein [Oscillospiraceae bacterium]